MRHAFSILSSVFLFASVSPAALAQNSSSSTLPDGAGKELVQAVCSGCHDVSRISRSAGYDSPQEWRRVFSTMIDLKDDQAIVVANYLAKHFPEDPSRRPTLVAGDTQIEITEWTTPTLGQRTRDPIEAPDGSIWWTGMWASLVGRLDPTTGEMREYKLPPAARPHSIIPDADGNIWYTGNSNATIGMLDPTTGEIKEYKTRAKDPHTAALHPNKQIYFTAQHAGMLGRLNPATGELTEVDTRPKPYGIKVGLDGTLWIAYNGTNKIGAMNPDTMEIRYYELPNPQTRVRRLDLDSHGNIWYVNSSLGKLGRLVPKTGEVTEWDSPSGPKAHPYAIAVINDVVWYNESGMRPDSLVRFDPKEESFQSWAIPSGVGIIRHVWVTKAGNLLTHQSSTNQVGLVKIRGAKSR